MATSGTVSQTTFRTNKVIEHAFRRCRLAPQQITPEYLDTAKDLLYLFLSTLASKGIALWCVDKIILPMYEAVQTVPCPIGTVDVLNANLRTSNRLEGTATASEGVADDAFDGDIFTECVQIAPAGYIQLALDSGTSAPLFGVLPGASGIWDMAFQGSMDGVTWTNLYRNATLTVVDQEWQWIDIEGVLNYSYYRLQAFTTTVLDVREFYIGELLNEIPVAKINRDDYANLPNKYFQGRPVQFYYDKQRDEPLLQLWPSPSDEFTFSQLVLYTQRYVQDVGSLTQTLDIPQRWFRAVVLNLAKDLCGEIPEVDPGLWPGIAQEAMDKLREAWDSETDSSPSYILPNISCYTR